MGERSIIEIAIIEDIDILREQLMMYLEVVEGFKVVFDCASVESYLHHLDNHSLEPDVLMLDVGLPGISGIEALPILRERQSSTEIIMLTSFEEQDIILKALCSGAVGYISKKASQTDIAEGIRVVHGGGSYMSPEVAREVVHHLVQGPQEPTSTLLSERQIQIIELLAEGESYAHIAEQLFISVETVRTHIKKMYRTLEVNNKAEAIAKFLRGEA